MLRFGVMDTLAPPRAASAPAVEGELERFREVQQLAYRCVEEVGAGLAPGVTERQAAMRIRRWLLDRGVEDWFHLPFAWFGDRTAFTGFRFPHQFFPTGRRLEEGMPYILDVAPVVGGHTADIGYAGCLGENAIWARLIADLAEYRELMLAGVRAGRTLRTVYDDVDRLLERHGYANRHRAYPFGVIAHRVGVVGGRGQGRTVGGFGVRALRTLFHDAARGRRAGWSPLWGPGRASDHPPTPGMWAVEPHIGFRGVGVKFEELLVVTDDDAFWLDDDLPHVRRWRAGAPA
jgi:Xaa-Pro aminopeptidase